MKINSHADVVIGLQYGDEGKGKITAGIASYCDYDLTARYNGGANAGHTVNLENNKQLRLHQIPSAVAYKQKGYIGPGSLIDWERLDNEELHFNEIMGFSPYEYLNISPKAIVVTQEHKTKDLNYHASSQGSTSSGVAPAYSEFYNRTTPLAKAYCWPNHKNEDIIKDIFETNKLLLEGAQGFYLNPYNGSYPYTTSSSSHPCSAAVTFGFSSKKIRHVIGVAKCYETRSGTDPFFDHLMADEITGEMIPESSIEGYQDRLKIYNKIQETGQEIGVTTGRKRKVRFLDLTRLIKAINETGTTVLVINKWDILDEFSLFNGGKFVSFNNIDEMKDYINVMIQITCPDIQKIFHSSSPKNDINWDFLN